MNPIRIAIHGAAGRMGRRLVALCRDDPELAVAAALEAADHPELGRDAGELAGVGPIGVPLTQSLDAQADVLIDFSTPAGAAAALQTCLQRRLALVAATTGLDADQQKRLRTAAQTLPIVWAPNMSLAVNLAMKLVDQAAAALKNHPGGADVEIVEWHHRFKEDAPSGTALRFGQIIARQMGQTQSRHGRQGRPGQRPREEIGYHAVRAGDHPGQHHILFGLLGESLELTVRATSRDCYALGALAAAKFLVGRPPGLYGMDQVLGLA